MDKRRIATVVGALAAAAACSAPAIAASDKDSKVIIKPGKPKFHGVVESDGQICTQGRKVKLLRITPGRDKVLGRDTTNDNGQWKILQRTPGTSTYYAKVKRETVNGSFCGGDRSNRVTK